MSGAWLIADTPRLPDPKLLEDLLGVDAFRARSLSGNVGVPFLLHFPEAAQAERASGGLAQAGLPTSWHLEETIAALPAAAEVSAIAPASEAPFWRWGNEAGPAPMPTAGSLRLFVHGRLQVEPVTPPPDWPSSASLCHRLEVFAAGPGGELLRFALRHDHCDFSGLGPARTLSAVRNLSVVRETLQTSLGAAPADELFDRTELSRSLRDVAPWTFYDLGGRPITIHARTSRPAFDLYARMRFLHLAKGRPERPGSGHYLEL